jgi:hypothetical protein
MSTHEWIPDKTKIGGGENQPRTTWYLQVPRINFGDKTANVSLAGWLDSGQRTHLCATCKKHVPMSFQFLAIFPALKANIDVFHFVYQVGEHKKGGPFSKDRCPESNTNVVRNYENPTSIRSAKVENNPASAKPPTEGKA